VKLTEHFTLEDFTRSQTAARHGIAVEPDETIVANLKRLCTLILEPLRAESHSPLFVLSGYRPPALNALVGGSDNSDHMYGRAADVVPVNGTVRALSQVLQQLVAGHHHEFPLKQGIVEFGRWLHVSVQPEGQTPTRELLTAYRADGRTAYAIGFDWQIRA
jgi:hypothetical protein